MISAFGCSLIHAGYDGTTMLGGALSERSCFLAHDVVWSPMPHYTLQSCARSYQLQGTSIARECLVTKQDSTCARVLCDACEITSTSE